MEKSAKEIGRWGLNSILAFFSMSILILVGIFVEMFLKKFSIELPIRLYFWLGFCGLVTFGIILTTGLMKNNKKVLGGVVLLVGLFVVGSVVMEKYGNEIKTFVKNIPAVFSQNTEDSIEPLTQSTDNEESLMLSGREVRNGSINFRQDERIEVINLNGDVALNSTDGGLTPLESGKIYTVDIKKINSGPLFFYSESGCTIKYRKLPKIQK